MKQYFVTSDIHSFYEIFHKSLIEAGWDIENSNHILIICGDLFDRGSEAKDLLKFLLSLPSDRLILIKGNHEYLMEDCLMQLQTHESPQFYHFSNGTVDTISQLTGLSSYDIALGFYDFKEDIRDKMKDYFNLVSHSLDYFELDNYIFVHGWIPHIRKYDDLHWCTTGTWQTANWYNGMQEWHDGWMFTDKTIVCGHWHTSYGNFRYHYKGSGEFEEDSDFSPFIDKGIVALDACTAFSNKVNIYKI